MSETRRTILDMLFRLGNDKRNVVHQDEDCMYLSRRPARGPGQEVVEVDPNDLRTARLCRCCIPDSPRARSFHRRCKICRTARPCPHNGGVPVFVDYTFHRETLLHAVGDTVTRCVHVWPENLLQHLSA
jgi:hypothetical protein